MKQKTLFDRNRTVSWKVVLYGAYLMLLLGSVHFLYEHPENAQAGATFNDITAATGFNTGSTESLTWADFDNDNDPDAYLTQNSISSSVLYVYDSGTNTYTDETVARGLGGLFKPTSSAWGDYNNDGYLDLYVTRSLSGSALYKNSGPPGYTFTDVAPSLGIDFPSFNGQKVVWSDLDNDNDLDLILGFSHTPYFNVLRNENAGTAFVLIFSGAGGEVTIDSTANGLHMVDYDDDCDPDLFITVHSESIVAPSGSVLVYKNKFQETGTLSFENVTNALFAGLPPVDPGNDINVAFADFDEDSDIDFYLSRKTGNNLLYIYKNNIYSDVTGTYFTNSTSNGDSATWGDYDHDGDLDLFATFKAVLFQSKLYKNNGLDTPFTQDAASGISVSGITDKGAVWIDMDNDGDLDLSLSNLGGATALWQNQLNDTSYLKVKVKGPNGELNQIGSKITLYKTGSNIIEGTRYVLGNTDNVASGDYTVHFGAPATDPISGNPIVYDATIRFTSCKETTRTGVTTTTTTVVQPISSITITPDNSSIPVGGNVQLTATVLPPNANQNVTWSSSDPGIATVDNNGMVRGVAFGAVTITATSVDCAEFTVEPVPVCLVATMYDTTTVTVTNVAEDVANGTLTPTVTLPDMVNSVGTYHFTSTHTNSNGCDQISRVTLLMDSAVNTPNNAPGRFLAYYDQDGSFYVFDEASQFFESTGVDAITDVSGGYGELLKESTHSCVDDTLTIDWFLSFPGTLAPWNETDVQMFLRTQGQVADTGYESKGSLNVDTSEPTLNSITIEGAEYQNNNSYYIDGSGIVTISVDMTDIGPSADITKTIVQLTHTEDATRTTVEYDWDANTTTVLNDENEDVQVSTTATTELVDDGAHKVIQFTLGGPNAVLSRNNVDTFIQSLFRIFSARAQNAPSTGGLYAFSATGYDRAAANPPTVIPGLGGNGGTFTAATDVLGIDLTAPNIDNLASVPDDTWTAQTVFNFEGDASDVTGSGIQNVTVQAFNDGVSEIERPVDFILYTDEPFNTHASFEEYDLNLYEEHPTVRFTARDNVGNAGYADFIPSIDYQNPRITGSIPADNSYIFNAGDAIKIVVNDTHTSIRPDSHGLQNVNTNNIKLFKVGPPDVPVIIRDIAVKTVPGDENTLHIEVTPEAPFELFSTYRIQVLDLPAPDAITDLADNALLGVPFTATFISAGHASPLRIEKSVLGSESYDWNAKGSLRSTNYSGSVTDWNAAGLPAPVENPYAYEHANIAARDFTAVFKTRNGTMLAASTGPDDVSPRVSVYRSVDKGINWTLITTLPSDGTTSITSFAQVTSGEIVFATCAAMPTVWRSANDGLNWTMVHRMTGDEIRCISQIVSSANGTGPDLYATVNNPNGYSPEYAYVMKSTDKGTSWGTFGPGIDSGVNGEIPLSVLSTSDGRVFVSTGVRSAQSGDPDKFGFVYRYDASVGEPDWIPTGFSDINTKEIYQIIQGENNNTFYIGTSGPITGTPAALGFIWKTTDSGATWKKIFSQYSNNIFAFKGLLFNKDLQMVYAAGTPVAPVTTGKLYVSNNGGDDWYKTGNINNIQYLNQVAYNNDFKVFVAASRSGSAYGDVYRTGKSVHLPQPARFNDGNFVETGEIQYDPTPIYETKNGTLYAGTTSPGYCLYKSANGGTTWTPIYLPNCRYINAFYEDRMGNLYAAGSYFTDYNTGSYKGAIYTALYTHTYSWNRIWDADIETYDDIYAITQSQTSGTLWAAGKRNTATTLLQSVDNGEDWALASGDSIPDFDTIYTIIALPSEVPPVSQPDPRLVDTVYVAGNITPIVDLLGKRKAEPAVWKSNDSAASWTKYSIDNERPITDMIRSRDGALYGITYVMVVTAGGGNSIWTLYKSIDNGVSWNEISIAHPGAPLGMTEGQNGSLYISGFEVTRSGGKIVTAQIVMESDDLGATWHKSGNINKRSSGPIGLGRVSRISTSNNHTLIASGWSLNSSLLDIIRSDQFETTPQIPTIVRDLEEDMLDGSLYVASDDGSVYLSDNQGSSWLETADIDNATDVHAVSVDSNGTLYAATSVKEDLYLGENVRPIYRSFDSGRSWSATPGDLDVMPGEFNEPIYTAIDVMVTDSNRVITTAKGVDPSDMIYSNIYYSDNLGASWAAVPVDYMISKLYKGNSGTLYAVGDTWQGPPADPDPPFESGLILKSTDNGSTWQRTSSFGPPEGITPYDIVEGIDSNLYVAAYDYIGNTGVIYKSTDAGGTWIQTATLAAPDSIFRLTQKSDGTFYGAGGDINGTYGAVYTSTDAISWTKLGDLSAEQYIYPALITNAQDAYVGSGNTVGKVFKYEKFNNPFNEVQKIFQDDGNPATDTDISTYRSTLYADVSYVVNALILAPHTIQDLIPPHFSYIPGSGTFTIFTYDNMVKAQGTVEPVITNEPFEGKKLTFEIPASGAIAPSWIDFGSLTSSEGPVGSFQTDTGAILAGGNASPILYRYDPYTIDPVTPVWTPVYTFPASVESVHFYESADNRLYAVTSGNAYVIESLDDGLNWAVTPGQPSSTNNLVFITERGGSLFTMGDGAFRSDDAGASWQTIHNPSLKLSSAILASDGYFYGTTNDGVDGIIQKSSDGDVWDPLSRILNKPSIGSLFEANNGILYLSDGETRVWKSADSGVNWSVTAPFVSLPDTVTGVYAITEITGENGALYASASIQEALLPGMIGHVYRSIDEGVSWVDVGSFNDEQVTNLLPLANGGLLGGFDSTAVRYGIMRILFDNARTNLEDIPRGGRLEVVYDVKVKLP